MEHADISFFDPGTDWNIVERGLPHWSQSGCVCFVTWRLNDSLPAEALVELDAEIETLLRTEGFDPAKNWKQQLAELEAKRRGEVQWKLFATRDKFLDKGYGSCVLADPRCSTIVLDSLKKFDMERYFQTDAVCSFSLRFCRRGTISEAV